MDKVNFSIIILAPVQPVSLWSCSESTNSDRDQVLFYVITGEPTYLQWIMCLDVNTVNVCYCRPPGHECGFYACGEDEDSTVGLDTVRILAQSQQITPDIRFTCDGMITKWIIVAKYGRHF